VCAGVVVRGGGPNSGDSCSKGLCYVTLPACVAPVDAKYRASQCGCWYGGKESPHPDVT
jgi:hypothetical protein